MPLYLLQVPLPLLHEWNSTSENRGATDSNFDEDEDMTDDCDTDNSDSDNANCDDENKSSSLKSFKNDCDSITAMNSDDENLLTE